MIPKSIEILVPWSSLDKPDMERRAEQLSAELKAEVPPGHALYGLNAKALAARIDRDEVLFGIKGDADRLAVVHLTWRPETDPEWPSTRTFSSWERWVNEDMIPAHKDYEP